MAVTVNPNGIKTLLANGFNTFFIQSNPVFSTGPKSLPKNPPDCPILTIEFLIILYSLKNYSQELNQALKLVY